MCGSTLLRCGVGDRCCDRSEGEHHSHPTEPLRQRSGRCGRRCTCRRTAGKGFHVQEVCVQGVCSLSPQMSLHKVVCSAAVVNLLCSVRCGFCDFWWFEGKSLFMSVCARVVLKLMWHSVRIDLHQLTSELKRFLFAIGTCLPGCGVPPHHIIRRVVAP